MINHIDGEVLGCLLIHCERALIIVQEDNERCEGGLYASIVQRVILPE